MYHFSYTSLWELTIVSRLSLLVLIKIFSSEETVQIVIMYWFYTLYMSTLCDIVPHVVIVFDPFVVYLGVCGTTYEALIIRTGVNLRGSFQWSFTLRMIYALPLH